MRIVSLDHPICVEGVKFGSITVKDPNERQRCEMARKRRTVAGFSYSQTIEIAAKLTAFGEVALRELSAVDYASLSLAIEEVFQAAVGRNARYVEFLKRQANA
jgi:hypothetical protein